MKITILCVGSLRESYLREAAAEYIKRLGPYGRVSVVEVKDDDKLSQYMSQSAYRIALAVEGKMMGSPALADTIQSQMQFYSEFIFIIGGADGLPQNIKDGCQLRLSFSPLTFPHQLMRVMLLEQIYRAFRIMNNEPYHK